MYFSKLFSNFSKQFLISSKQFPTSSKQFPTSLEQFPISSELFPTFSEQFSNTLELYSNRLVAITFVSKKRNVFGISEQNTKFRQKDLWGIVFFANFAPLNKSI